MDNAGDDLAAYIDRAAFEWLREHGVVDSATELQALALDPRLLAPEPKWFQVLHAIMGAYSIATPLSLDGLDAHLSKLTWKRGTIPRPLADSTVPTATAQTDDHRDRCHFEFTRAYLGADTIPAQLKEYISECAKCSGVKPDYYKFPYISIEQSSGFGKSRLLRELARLTKDDPVGAMKVLYTCVRTSNADSSTYPQATANLRDYLFPSVVSNDTTPMRSENENDLESELTAKLFRLFDFAIRRWDSVGNDWFTLFDDQADAAICLQFRDHKLPDEAARYGPKGPRVLVLAIDEARYLLQNEHDLTGWFHRLRRALRAALEQIHKTFGVSSAIFAIVVDTNFKIADFVPPAVQDPSSRAPNSESVLFPPFVLTQTMDIRFDELVKGAQSDGLTSNQFYQQLVAYEYNDAWSKLACMGRPLWDRVKLKDWRAREESTKLIQLAADELLGGRSAKNARNFNQESLFGVASVLCRVGVRPYTWSPLASRTVADFMGTLVYSSFSHDQLITTYSSEPILTLGAARVWYQSNTKSDVHARLAEQILPQFRKLLCQDVVDTGGVGELVSRLVLLLVMDATGEAETTLRDKRQYAGEFRSVEKFLCVMYGNEPLLIYGRQREDVTATHKNQLEAMLLRWRGWKVGFSHFVQLSEMPNESVLWAMLARRAAGIFPRNTKGVDLIIPIFKGATVSMALIQVKNRADGDPAFPDSASTAMWPSVMFTNELKQRGRNDVVLIYMSLRGAHATARKSFYLADPGRRRSQRKKHGAKVEYSYVLCLEGLSGWNAHRGSRPPEDTESGASAIKSPPVPVVSDGVAEELRRLLEPWSDVMRLVEEDLARRDKRFGVRGDVVRLVAERPLVKSRLMTWKSAAADVAVESAQCRSEWRKKPPLGCRASQHVGKRRPRSRRTSDGRVSEQDSNDRGRHKDLGVDIISSI